MAILTKNWNVADEFTALMSRHLQSETEKQKENIANEFMALIERMIELEKKKSANKIGKISNDDYYIQKRRGRQYGKIIQKRVYSKRARCPYHKKRERKANVLLRNSLPLQRLQYYSLLHQLTGGKKKVFRKDNA